MTGTAHTGLHERLDHLGTGLWNVVRDLKKELDGLPAEKTARTEVFAELDLLKDEAADLAMQVQALAGRLEHGLLTSAPAARSRHRAWRWRGRPETR